ASCRRVDRAPTWFPPLSLHHLASVIDTRLFLPSECSDDCPTHLLASMTLVTRKVPPSSGSSPPPCSTMPESPGLMPAPEPLSMYIMSEPPSRNDDTTRAWIDSPAGFSRGSRGSCVAWCFGFSSGGGAGVLSTGGGGATTTAGVSFH